MKPIPFNLERAKAGDPILINGCPATFGAHNPNASKFSMVVLWDSSGTAWAVSEKGFGVGGSQLVTMAPKKRVVWVNMYNGTIGVVCQSKEDANERPCGSRIACVRVEFTEGEGL